MPNLLTALKTADPRKYISKQEVSSCKYEGSQTREFINMLEMIY